LKKLKAIFIGITLFIAMTSNTNKDFGPAFDCSSNVLAHGIPLPQYYQGYCLTPQPTYIMEYTNNHVVDSGEKAFNFPTVMHKQTELSESSETSSTENYYPVEYSNFKSFVNQNFSEDFASTGSERNLIREISAAEERLEPQWPKSVKTLDELNAKKIEQWIYNAEKLSPEEMFWKKMTENPHLFELWLNGRALKEKSSHQCTLKYENTADECLKGLCENPSDNCDEYHWNSFENYHYTSKRSHCRYFQKGRCRRGRTCNFLHDQGTMCPSSQKVFLGGLPSHITEFTLRLKLAQHGYRVINKPVVLRGYAPHVCMGSIEEAQELIAKKSILIDGSFVDVRAY